MKELTSIHKAKTTRMTYSKHVLDGFSYIDRTTCYELLKSIIPSTLRTSRTPYLPIRQLLNFFDAHEGARNKIRGGRRFCESVAMFSVLTDSLDKINRLDNEIFNILYKTARNYSSSELLNNVKWRMDDILTELRKFMVELNKTDLVNYFGNEDVINGSPDGKRKGIVSILFDANAKISEILDFFNQMEKLVANGNDPMSYRLR